MRRLLTLFPISAAEADRAAAYLDDMRRHPLAF